MRKSPTALAALSLMVALPALADEGMWPYNMAPVEQVKESHGFTLTDGFLKSAMLSSVRFNNGGSGSFVSGEGLVMTNHHVGADCIQKLSTGEGQTDVMEEGFTARDRAAEKRCPDLELNQLREVSDVTAQVNAAAAGKGNEAAQNQAKKAEMTRLEKQCSEGSDLRCDVVTLWAGGAFHLYQYKKYTDVRLVFAPEVQAAFFGGDPDNFNFPRYALDAAFFRVWEDGKPALTEAYLPFSKEGAKVGDLVFVSGHPGSTDRFAPVSKLRLLRDATYPFILEQLGRQRERLVAFAAKGKEQEQAARKDLFSIENSIKALTGYQRGLTDEALMAAASAREASLKEKVAQLDAASKARVTEAFTRLDKAYQGYGAFSSQLAVTERSFSPASSALGSRARHLVRLAAELPKESGERLREYRETNLKSLELSLFSEAPIHLDLEIEKLAFSLELMRDVLGPAHPTVGKVLAGKQPRARADEVVRGTRVHEVAFRKELYEGGQKAVDAAKDPLLELARALDPLSRQLRQRFEDEVEATEAAFNGRIVEAWGKVFGTSLYPDATFTLRINPGVVKGYQLDGKKVPHQTQLGGLFVKSKRHKGAAPYQLPESFERALPNLDLSVPYNFVSTNDIIGGNSGSPVIGTDGKVVGLIFDGNIHQLPNRFVYTDAQARSVSVHTAGILHTLERVYGAEDLVKELVGDPES
jgi:hypothetical protein